MISTSSDKGIVRIAAHHNGARHAARQLTETGDELGEVLISCRRIVVRHGSRLWATATTNDELPKGRTFNFSRAGLSHNTEWLQSMVRLNAMADVLRKSGVTEGR